jgi:hypothetical protein
LKTKTHKPKTAPKSLRSPIKQQTLQSPGKIPGAPVDRPEWLPENFWNAEDGEANYEGLAKSWADMRKMVSQGAHKAPPDGKYDTSVFKTENLEEDPLASAYLGWAQKYGVSQGRL